MGAVRGGLVVALTPIPGSGTGGGEVGAGGGSTVAAAGGTGEVGVALAGALGADGRTSATLVGVTVFAIGGSPAVGATTAGGGTGAAAACASIAFNSGGSGGQVFDGSSVTVGGGRWESLEGVVGLTGSGDSVTSAAGATRVLVGVAVGLGSLPISFPLAQTPTPPRTMAVRPVKTHQRFQSIIISSMRWAA
jgi:hypothetical protein